MKRIDLNAGDLVDLYKAGLSAPRIAVAYGVSASVVRRHLTSAGLTLTGNRLIFDEAAALRAFQEGSSVKAVAERFGVQRNTITKLLHKHGITPRSRRDAMLLRMAQATPEERLRLTEAAHAARRGRSVPEQARIRIAEGRERAKAHASDDARLLAGCIEALNIPVTLEKAVGPYNIDIAFNECPVAVEIQGGNWHAHGRHGARIAERREYILSRGWHLVEIWRLSDYRTRPMQAMAHQLITMAKGFRLDPSGRGEHRVIRGDGQPLAALKSYGYDVAPVPGSDHRCEESGRYVSVA